MYMEVGSDIYMTLYQFLMACQNLHQTSPGLHNRILPVRPFGWDMKDQWRDWSWWTNATSIARCTCTMWMMRSHDGMFRVTPMFDRRTNFRHVSLVFLKKTYQTCGWYVIPCCIFWCQNEQKVPVVYESVSVFSKMLHISICFWRICSKRSKLFMTLRKWSI